MHTHPQRRAIALIETVIAMLLIAFVLISSIQIVAPIVRSSHVHTDRLVAANLASELTEEIATKHFIDPAEDDPDTLGPEADERPANRLDFDDIDDYQSWSASPPRNSQNDDITTLAGWTRSVKVVHADPADPNTDSGTYTGVKRITIVVSKNGTELERRVLVHTAAADKLGFLVTPLDIDTIVGGS